MRSSLFLFDIRLRLFCVAIGLVCFSLGPGLSLANTSQPLLPETQAVGQPERIEKISAVDSRTLVPQSSAQSQALPPEIEMQSGVLGHSSTSLPTAMVLLISGLLVLRVIRR